MEPVQTGFGQTRNKCIDDLNTVDQRQLYKSLSQTAENQNTPAEKSGYN